MAKAAGFDRVGICGPGPFAESAAFLDWLERGYHGAMSYLAREPQRRVAPAATRPWVRSVIALAVDYNTDHPTSVEVPDDPSRGWISRYAWGRDYHDVLERKLAAFAKAAEVHPLTAGRYHYYVDHGPVLERVYGHHAGLGWFGKNTMLIHPRFGSYFFLAVVLTDADLSHDAPVVDHCGSCTRCLDACPTGAFPEPHVLDATRCISYWTIEQREDIPPTLQEQVGFHVFGCDICQDVCPYNRRAPFTEAPEFQPRPGLFHPHLDDLLADDEEQFRRRHTKSPIKRRKWQGLRWNVQSARHRAGTLNFPTAELARAKRLPRRLLRPREIGPRPTGERPREGV